MSTEFPVEITAEAAQQAARVLTRNPEMGSFIRLGVKGGGCSGFEYLFRIDSARREGDVSLTLGGVEFVVDPRSSKFLLGARLIVTGNLLGPGLAFENPNAAKSCGCGTSFTPKNL